MLITADLVEEEKYIGVKWLRGLLYCYILQKGIQIRANLILNGTKKNDSSPRSALFTLSPFGKLRHLIAT